MKMFLTKTKCKKDDVLIKGTGVIGAKDIKEATDLLIDHLEDTLGDNITIIGFHIKEILA